MTRSRRCVGSSPKTTTLNVTTEKVRPPSTSYYSPYIDITLTYGVEVSSHAYDGQRERSETGFLSVNLPV